MRARHSLAGESISPSLAPEILFIDHQIEQKSRPRFSQRIMTVSRMIRDLGISLKVTLASMLRAVRCDQLS